MKYWYMPHMDEPWKRYMLSERSQLQKAIHLWFQLYEMSRGVNHFVWISAVAILKALHFVLYWVPQIM